MKIIDKFKLNGRIALVTGASRGLGQGMAVALGSAGASVALEARTKPSLEETAKMIQETGSKAHVLQADLSKTSESDRVVRETVAQFGKLDILVNSIGMQVRKPALEVVEKEFDDLIGVNLKSVYFLTQAAAKEMIKNKKGKIINITSLTSFIGLPNVSIYGASKGGILTLTRQWAIEWAKYNINVNAIGPGYFITALTADLFKNEDGKKWVLSKIPLGRTGEPSDLAGAAVFLASEASDYITGQILNVDGGWLAG
ncbi:MAG: glucose 1-dehydrogenase [Deltaproteobacteria bacterium]|nr:glucose 1-dehydrogenase [Deltaproteobacteria bacterium]